jgi:DNA-binding CsgD family transcriptional regulator
MLTRRPVFGMHAAFPLWPWLDAVPGERHMVSGGGSERLAIIARTTELEAIREFLARVPERASVLVLEGEAGIGKTTIWREAIEEARAASYRLLIARPGETESKPAYGGLVDLLGEALEEVLGKLPAPQATTIQAALLREPGRVEQAGAVAVATLNTLRALAARGPVVLAVDDLQWLDAPSKRVLLHVARRLDREPIGLVATERPPTVLIGLPEERLSRLRIGPLSLASLHHLVRDRLSVSLERPLLVRVARSSGGNPLFALEIVRALQADGFKIAAGTALPIPASLRTLASRRLARLPPSAREAVLCTYCLSRPTPELVERALRLAGQPPEGLSVAVEAEVLELVGEIVRLAHPLVGSVLYGGLVPSARHALHARLARLPLDPEEHAYQRALAATGPDPDAAAIAEATAHAASARGAPETAAELLEIAVRLTPSSDEEARLRRIDRSAMAHFIAGGSVKAVAQWEEIARTAPPGLVRAHAIWRLAEFGSSSLAGGFEGVPALLESVVDEAKSDPSLHADVEASLGEFILWGRGPVAAEPHARTALKLAERGTGRRTLAHALVTQALTDFFRGRGRPLALLERAVAIETEGPGIQTEIQIEILPSAYRAYVYAWMSDAPVQAAALLDEKLEQASREHDESSMPFLLWQRCEVALSLGEFDAAAALAARCRDAVESTGRVGRRGGALYCQALIEGYRGRVHEAFALARSAVELDEPRGVLYNLGFYRGLLGFVELSLDRPEEALEWLEPAHRALLEQGYGEPAMFRFVPDQVEALVSLGRVEDADAVLAPYERAARRLHRRSALASAARCRGLLLGATGEANAALDELTRAVRLEQELGRPFEHARALLAQGVVARRAKYKNVADDALGRAVELFELLGTPLWAERARAERRRIGLRRGSPAALTETERRVAELAAAGRQNREIAAELFMSVRAVEANLTRAYRKLGVRSRSGLAARFAGDRAG